METYFIKTFGCQMNFSDSERISAFLEEQGFEPAQKDITSDLIVFNTCGVRQTAENRAYSMIHVLRKNYRNTKIVMTGCLASRPDVKKRLANKVDLFTDIENFPKNFEKFIKSKIINHRYPKIKHYDNYLSIIPKHTSQFQFYVPIMTGCNNFCSYCVVPYARGRETSRPSGEIISEIKKLTLNGCKHIMLLGQNVNSYQDSRNIGFSKLLKKINSLPGKFWISFISSHPKDFDDELIETVAKCNKVCEWVHLPIQAGNDEIIRKMNRHYTQKQYLEKIAKIRESFKKYKPQTLYSLTSDIIVGFPGETKKQFLESAEVMKKVSYDMVFFGQFSPRPGTTAWEMKDNVSKKEKARREKYLNDILAKTTFENNKKYVRKVVEILIENFDGKSYFGKTRTMKNVRIESKKKNLVGKIVKVKITKANIWNLEGEIK